MNDVERKQFWKTLCSLDGKDIAADSKKLKETIVLPEKLYRYRSLSVNSLEALKNNRLYFSTADYYDDPFDTFINVRIKGIRPSIMCLQDADEQQLGLLLKLLVKSFKGVELESDAAIATIMQLKEVFVKEESKAAMEAYFRNIRNEIKKDIFSACFSESPVNETLWLKYAEQHKGFAVEYDLLDEKKKMCGKQDKCTNCGINKFGMSLYPIYYSDEMYDATSFAQYLAACKAVGDSLNDDILRKIQLLFGKQIWESEKISLIKKSCHKYDEEWRLIITAPMNAPVCCEWIPSAVYLGLNMNPKDMDLVSDIAKSAGVEKIYKCVITDEGKLDTELIG